MIKETVFATGIKVTTADRILIAGEGRTRITSMPHAKTVEDVRSEVLEYIRSIAAYWATLPDKTPAERCDGVAFSILVMIDGETVLPAMTLSLAPHEEDRKFNESRGENWYEPRMVINGDVMLYEEYCRQTAKEGGGGVNST